MLTTSLRKLDRHTLYYPAPARKNGCHATRNHQRCRSNAYRYQQRHRSKSIPQVDCNKWPRPKTMFCCMLTYIQGGAIQANMDVYDTKYFNGILRMDATYQIFLLDYIGRIQRIDDELIVSGGPMKKRVIRRTISIQSLDGDSRLFTVWNEMAMGFDIQTYAAMEKQAIIAVSSCYVKSYGGVQLLGTPATHYYLNPDIQEVHQMLNVAFGSDTNFRGMNTKVCRHRTRKDEEPHNTRHAPRS